MRGRRRFEPVGAQQVVDEGSRGWAEIVWNPGATPFFVEEMHERRIFTSGVKLVALGRIEHRGNIEGG